MISFLNDYNELCHPQVMNDLVALQGEVNVGYSEDDHVANAISLIKDTFETEDVDVHFIHGGTATNAVAIATSLRSFEGVITCDTGHIVGHENGAIESLGFQLIQAKNKDGKICLEELDRINKENQEEYKVVPKLLYISNATELGTVYTKSELETLSKYCKENDIYIYMDGARLATALYSKKSDLKASDLVKYLDIFSIGGTKNGMIAGEALIIVNKELSKGFRKTLKQKGSMLAKGYFLGMQFETMFKDGLYFELGKDAVEKAEYLAKTFVDKGVKLYKEQESNLVFVILSQDQIERLSEDFLFEKMQEVEKDQFVVRFVTRWATTKEEIDKLGQAL